MEKQELKKIRRFDIDAGVIFCNLEDNYSAFETSFLRGEVWNGYKKLAVERRIENSFKNEGKDDENYLNRLKVEYDRAVEDEHNDTFPFPDFYLYLKGGRPVGWVSYTEPCIIRKDDSDFDLFFALKAFDMDIMVLEGFLAFHLTHNFKGDVNEYCKFLKLLCHKYAPFLEKRHTPVIADFIERRNSDEKAQPGDGQHATGKSKEGYTLDQQVLFFHFLFKKLGVDRHNAYVTDIARIVQGLTSRQLSAKEIKNTDVYKRLANPLNSSKKGGFKDDLRFVRDLFEQLNLQDIVSEINKEIKEE